MQHRADLYELIDYEDYNQFDTSVFNFQHRPLTPLRGRTHMTETEIKKGLAGVVADYTAVSKVNPETNSLLYRGYPVQELAATQPFEAVAYLLWYGELPTDEQLAEFVRRGRANRALDENVSRRSTWCRSRRTRWTSCAPRSRCSEHPILAAFDNSRESDLDQGAAAVRKAAGDGRVRPAPPPRGGADRRRARTSTIRRTSCG